MPREHPRAVDSASSNRMINTIVQIGFVGLVPLAVFMSGTAPRALTHLFLALSLVIAAFLVANPKILHLFRDSRAFFITALLFAIYIALSALWSANPNEPMIATSMVLAMLPLFAAPVIVSRFKPSYLRWTMLGLLVCYAIATTFTVFELMADMPFLRKLDEYLGHIVKVKLRLSYLNKNTTMLVFFFWPLVLIIRSWWPGYMRNALTGLLVITMLVMLSFTQSETAKLAFAVSSLAFVAAYFLPSFTFNSLRLFWIIAVTMMVPIVLMLSAAGLQYQESLQPSARHRVVIWDYTAHQVLQNPLKGIGIRSDRYNDKDKDELVEKIGKIEFRKKGWHPHNMFLQTWYELGVFGALFILLLGLFLLNAIRRLESHLRPYALASFCAFCCIASVGWGMWQPWLISAYGWSILICLIAFEYHRNHTAENDASD